MKMLLIAVLAVFTAASTLSAQDTLRIRSYQIVNVCSDERRWLLAVDLGRVLPSDSLVSFDITIGYDRTKLRPTDVLKEGTLSAGMSYAPFLNTVVPNEMRIAGGNIIKTVSGNEPLVAIAGDFLGSCGQVDTLGYPWPATFNSEFKKRLTVVRIDSVKAEAIGKQNPLAGLRSTLDKVEVPSGETIVEIPVNGALLQLDSVPYRFTFSSSHPGISIVQDRGLKGLVNLEVQSTGSQLTVTGNAVGTQPEFLLKLDVSTMPRPDTVTIVMKTENLMSCGCYLPTLRDTVEVKINPTVSVASTDEHIGIINVQSDAFVIQCDHEEMKTVQIYSFLGQEIFSSTFTGSVVTVPTSNLADGSYIIRTTCGNKKHVNLILK